MWTFLIDHAEGIIGWVGGVVTAIGTFWKVYIRPRINKRVESENRREAILHKILKEVGTNGGNSLRDAVDRLESRMQFNEYKQDLALSIQGTGIARTDPAGNWLAVNRALQYQSGRVEVELLGRNWVGAICDSIRDSMVADYDSCVRDKRNFEYMALFCRSSGAELRVQIVAWPMFDKTGALSGYILFSKVIMAEQHWELGGD